MIAQPRANEIAYALMVLLASKRKPGIEFITSITEKIGRDANEKKRIVDDLLKKFPMEELERFTIKLFEDGFNFNIQNFKLHFSEIVEKNEGEKVFENGSGEIKTGTKVSFETEEHSPWGGKKEGTLVFAENQFHIKLDNGFGLMTIGQGNGGAKKESIKAI